MDLVFVDTNVLIYNEDHTDPSKLAAASAWLNELWIRHVGRLSWQVLVELYNNLLTKVQPVIDAPAAQMIVERYLPWQPIAPDITMFRRAWELQDRHSLSWSDALIVGAASITGCRYLLTEDMHYGEPIGGVTLISPFEHLPAEILRD